MLSGDLCRLVVVALGGHSWSSGLVAVVGGSGTSAGSTCIGDAGLVAG